MAVQLPVLDEAVQAAIQEVGNVDILVGIPSYNNARTIGHVVRAVQAGLAKYFPQARSVLVNSDGGSQDGTREIVWQAQIEDPHAVLLVSHPLFPVHKIITPYFGIPGKGSAFRTIFQIAETLGIRACAVVDSDLRSITPEWIQLLLEPVYAGKADYVSPLYLRHKYDGTITNSIVHPLTRALYGKRIRQPIGGEFGFSGELASLYLSKDVWESEVARYGIDIWMTTTALCEGYRVCQAFLGAKIHDAKDPGSDLSAMLVQVVGSVFSLMETYHPVWSEVQGSEAVPTFGFQYAVGLEPIKVNLERMQAIFHQGCKDLLPIWEQILRPETARWLLSVEAGPTGRDFRFPAELWVRVIYDFALADHRRVIHREHLLKSLIPLYLGRTASFVLETEESTALEVEELLEGLCQTFEQLKPYLIEAWR